jgi:hypothetical protein
MGSVRRSHAYDPREGVQVERDLLSVGRMQLRQRVEALPEVAEEPEQRELFVGEIAARLSHGQSVTSAAPPTIRTKRGTTARASSRATHAMSSSRPGGPYVRALIPSTPLP